MLKTIGDFLELLISKLYYIYMHMQYII